MRRLLVLLAAAACSGGTSHPDAGPMLDTSCGIDCDSQKAFGLLEHTCFEYSDSNSSVSPPALTAEVQPVVSLEGGVKVMKLLYAQNGQPKMTDSFTITAGVLKLVRREWGGASSSVSYQNSDTTLDGAQWIGVAPEVGSSLETMDSARFIQAATDTTTSVDYRVSFQAPSSSELHVPAGYFDGGVKLLFNETPDHGADTRRVYAQGVGFTLVATPLAPVGTALEYRLQNLKNTADAGACGF